MSSISLQYQLENWKGGDSIRYMKNSPHIPITIAVLYLVIVWAVPRYVMAHRAPVAYLKPVIAAWNLFFTVFSVLGVYYSLPVLLRIVRSEYLTNLAPKWSARTQVLDQHPRVPGGIYTSLCYWNANIFENGMAAFWLLVFDLSKIPEMMDTVFLILQKKPVVFLHWYHHLTVMLFCWHAHVTYISNGLCFAVMNMAVHSVMYFYYFMCACGQRKFVRPFAPLITLLQLLQMVAGLALVLYTGALYWLHPNSCETNSTSIIMGVLMYASYFILFVKLFRESYVNRQPK